MSALPPPPIPMSNPMIMNSTTAIFYWQAPIDISGSPITNYEFTVGDISGVVDVSITYYQVDNLIPGVTVTPSIRSSSDNGETWGESAEFPPFTPINSPQFPPASATATPLTRGSAEINWEPPQEAPEGYAYYTVQSVSSNERDPTIGLATADLTQLSCKLSELNPDSSYYFKVYIVNSAGSSDITLTNTIEFEKPSAEEIQSTE